MRGLQGTGFPPVQQPEPGRRILSSALPEVRRQGSHSAELLAFLQDRLHLLDGPAFAGSDHVHLSAFAHEHVRAYVVVGSDDRELGLGLPVERDTEVAGENLPTRAIVEFDDVALGMGFDLHGFCAPAILSSAFR